ncbi:MAG: DNA topoisomerase, partial [Pseudomonadota bacterium]|nr:DNA topoisomerase [Pseudomonadota bacterium]
MTKSHLVIVESPAKTKTIKKYLGPTYEVLASFGHIRDLLPKDGSVRPEDGFAMDWELSDKAKRSVQAIVKAAREADSIYLATDPDREGEAISWHIIELLKDKKILKDKPVHRVAFNEITKDAVRRAFAESRSIDTALVEAYLARRALDYLFGFSLSPVLWRKLPGARSAGRVQSVSLRLVCERESEIERFVPREYWQIQADLQKSDGADVTARLIQLNGKKLGKFTLGDADAADMAADAVTSATFSVGTIERKRVKRHPSPPFITSTLQQEASRKLGFSATHTMRTAQALYEGIAIDGE